MYRYKLTTWTLNLLYLHNEYRTFISPTFLINNKIKIATHLLSLSFLCDNCAIWTLQLGVLVFCSSLINCYVIYNSILRVYLECIGAVVHWISNSMSKTWHECTFSASISLCDYYEYGEGEFKWPLSFGT